MTTVFEGVLLEMSCAFDSPGDFVKLEILVPLICVVGKRVWKMEC